MDRRAALTLGLLGCYGAVTPARAGVMFFCWGRRGLLGDQAVVGAGG